MFRLTVSLQKHIFNLKIDALLIFYFLAIRYFINIKISFYKKKN